MEITVFCISQINSDTHSFKGTKTGSDEIFLSGLYAETIEKSYQDKNLLMDKIPSFLLTVFNNHHSHFAFTTPLN